MIENTQFPTQTNLAALQMMIKSHTVTYIIAAVDADSTDTIQLLGAAGYHVQILQCNVLLDGYVISPNTRLDHPTAAARLGYNDFGIVLLCSLSFLLLAFANPTTLVP